MNDNNEIYLNYQDKKVNPLNPLCFVLLFGCTHSNKLINGWSVVYVLYTKRWKEFK